MVKNLTKMMAFVVMGLLIFGCGKRQIKKTETFSPYEFEADQYESKVDTFLVILDASESMSQDYKISKAYKKKMKFQSAKDFLSAMNKTIPDVDVKGALRTFGHHPSVASEKTVLFYGVTEYSEEGFGLGLASVTKPGGTSPLSTAINAGMTDLEQSRGEIAVIMVSDGWDMAGTTIESAREMKNKFGDRLCTYTVLVGDDLAGEQLLKEIAESSECGFSVRADVLSSSGAMGTFVEKVLLVKAPDSDGDGVFDKFDQCPDTPKGVEVDAEGCPLDTDGDGVYDYLDKCPETPEGVAVDAHGCPLDTDGDGVYDYLDKCPDTPEREDVDANGCPLDSDNDGVYDSLDKCPETPEGAEVDQRGCWVYETVVLFDFGSYEVKSDAYSMLDAGASVLERNPDIRVEIQGHTDNVGSGEYNMKLSEKRAQAVADYFVEQGVGAERLTVTGYGLTRPAYPNDTPENQAKNRRVELKPIP